MQLNRKAKSAWMLKTKRHLTFQFVLEQSRKAKAPKGLLKYLEILQTKYKGMPKEILFPRDSSEFRASMKGIGRDS